MRFILSYGFLFLSFLSANAQKLSTDISKESIRIGEETTITYKVITPTADSVVFDSFTAEIPSRAITGGNLQQDGTMFEILVDFADSVVYKGQKKIWTGRYVVTAWDSGVFVIPGPRVIIDDSVFYFEDLLITCDLTEHDPKVELYDIRENFADIPDEPFDIGRFLSSNWWWIAMIFVAVFIYVLIRRRRRREDVEPEIRVSLKQRTLLAIEALEKDKLWEKDKLKEHFVELSYILRSYLTARYDISLLEKTTRQTRILLKEKGLEDDTIDTINRILFQSDMVKFAKSMPDSMEILKISALAKQIVAETSPLEIEDAD